MAALWTTIYGLHSLSCTFLLELVPSVMFGPRSLEMLHQAQEADTKGLLYWMWVLWYVVIVASAAAVNVAYSYNFDIYPV